MKKIVTCMLLTALVCFGTLVNAQTPSTTTSSSSAAAQKIEVPVVHFGKVSMGPKDSSTWFRYYQAGESAYVDKKDPELAKRYWFQALSELEQGHTMPRGKDPLFLAKMSALEQGLDLCYPKPFPEDESVKKQSLALEKEYVGIMYRIAMLNRKVLKPNDLLIERSTERYNVAQSDYEMALKKPAVKTSSAQEQTGEKQKSQ